MYSLTIQIPEPRLWNSFGQLCNHAIGIQQIKNRMQLVTTNQKWNTIGIQQIKME